MDGHVAAPFGQLPTLRRADGRQLVAALGDDGPAAQAQPTLHASQIRAEGAQDSAPPLRKEPGVELPFHLDVDVGKRRSSAGDQVVVVLAGTIVPVRTVGPVLVSPAPSVPDFLRRGHTVPQEQLERQFLIGPDRLDGDTGVLTEDEVGEGSKPAGRVVVASQVALAGQHDVRQSDLLIEDVMLLLVAQPLSAHRPPVDPVHDGDDLGQPELRLEEQGLNNGRRVCLAAQLDEQMLERPLFGDLGQLGQARLQTGAHVTADAPAVQLHHGEVAGLGGAPDEPPIDTEPVRLVDEEAELQTQLLALPGQPPEDVGLARPQKASEDGRGNRAVHRNSFCLKLGMQSTHGNFSSTASRRFASGAETCSFYAPPEPR